MNKLKLPTVRPEIEATELDQLCEMFLESKGAALKGASVKNYRGHIAKFRRFWRDYGIKHDYKLTPDTFKEFDRWVQTDYRNSHGNGASSYAMTKTSRILKQFCDWLAANQCVPFPISDWVIERKLIREPQFWPTQEQNQRIFDVLSLEPTRLRDMAAFAFMLATGARRIEVSNAKIENFHFNTPITNIKLGDDHGGYCHLEVTKGSVKRDVWFGSEAGLLAKVWIRASGVDSGTWLGLLGDGVAHVMRRASRACGIPELSCHSGRRAFVDYWATKHAGDGLAYQTLKLQLGHSMNGREDVTMSRYINVSNPNRVRELLQKYHCSPMDEMKIDWQRLPVQIDG